MADRPAPPESWAGLPFFSTRWPALWDRLQATPGWQPEPAAIFRALHLTPRPAVRVVILGQDPYETQGRATGLAFELGQGHETSQSLKGIRAELRREAGDNTLGFPNFPNWAGQGVLLLNTALTVRIGRAGSHAGFGWSELVTEILGEVWNLEGAIFLLWGRHAIRTAHASGLNLSDARMVLTGHPRGGRPPRIAGLPPVPRFKGSKPFLRANQWLAGRNLPPVNWTGT